MQAVGGLPVSSAAGSIEACVAISALSMSAMRFTGLLLLCLGSGIACAQSLPLTDSPLLVAQAQTVITPVKKPAVKKPSAVQSKATSGHKITTKPVASKTRQRKDSDAVAADLPKAKLDLSLPKAMVHDLEPAKKIDAAAPPREKSLLPSYFDEKKSDDFQLNGRLLSNELQLQRRNDNNREVEGAALDFEFKQ